MMKEEMDKENDFLTELLNMEEAPNHQTNKVMCPMLSFCKHLSLVVKIISKTKGLWKWP